MAEKETKEAKVKLHQLQEENIFLLYEKILEDRLISQGMKWKMDLRKEKVTLLRRE